MGSVQSGLFSTRKRRRSPNDSDTESDGKDEVSTSTSDTSSATATTAAPSVAIIRVNDNTNTNGNSNSSNNSSSNGGINGMVNGINDSSSDQKRSGPQQHDDATDAQNDIKGDRAIKRMRTTHPTHHHHITMMSAPTPNAHHHHGNDSTNTNNNSDTVMSPSSSSSNQSSEMVLSVISCRRCDELENELKEARQSLIAARRAIANLTSGLACCICLSIMIQPLSLSCGHSMCANCLLNHVQHNISQHNDNKVNNDYYEIDGTSGRVVHKCPQCRGSIKESPREASIAIRSAIDEAVSRFTPDELAERNARLPLPIGIDNDEEEVGDSSDHPRSSSSTRDRRLNEIMTRFAAIWRPNARKPVIDSGIPMCSWCGFEVILSLSSPSPTVPVHIGLTLLCIIVRR
jgi:hypothetical protein